MPKGPKRPADVVSNAVHVMKVLTGEAEDTPAPDDGKDLPAAKALGGAGGAARAAKLTPSSDPRSRASP